MFEHEHIYISGTRNKWPKRMKGWRIGTGKIWKFEGMVVFPECVARVPVSLGGLGVRLRSRKVAFATATVRNRRQPFATVRSRLREGRKALHSGECVWSGPETVSSWLLVAAVILVSAEEVSVWVICVAAVILAFAEEVSVRMICVAAVILVSAEEVSVWVICVAAVILVFAEEVSVRVICVAAVILAFAEEVSVRVICVAAVILVSAAEVSVWAICVSRRVSRKSVQKIQECQVRVSQKKSQARASYKSVKEECLTRVSSKSVPEECQVRVSYKNVK